MLFRNFHFLILSSLVLCSIDLISVNGQSDYDIDDNGDDGQGVDDNGSNGQVSCPVCPSALSEPPQGLFGKPSLMQSLTGVRVQGFENTLGTRLGDFLFGPVSTLPPVTRVVRQTGSRNRGRPRGRGRGRGRGRQRGRIRGRGRGRRPRRGRGGRRGQRGRFRGDRKRRDVEISYKIKI